MSTCRSCQARIVWAVTEKGKRIPLDEEPVADGTFKIDRTAGEPVAVFVAAGERSGLLLKSHHATCPQGASWKKART